MRQLSRQSRLCFYITGSRSKGVARHDAKVWQSARARTGVAQVIACMLGPPLGEAIRLTSRAWRPGSPDLILTSTIALHFDNQCCACKSECKRTSMTGLSWPSNKGQRPPVDTVARAAPQNHGRSELSRTVAVRRVSQGGSRREACPFSPPRAAGSTDQIRGADFTVSYYSKI